MATPMRKATAFMSSTLFLLLLLASAQFFQASGSEPDPAEYKCPMAEHAGVSSEQAGRCPKCGLNLVLLPKNEHAPAASDSCAIKTAASCGATPGQTGAAVQTPHNSVYTCPMDTDYRSDKPGKCPICGMNLVLGDGQGEKAAATLK